MLGVEEMMIKLPARVLTIEGLIFFLGEIRVLKVCFGCMCMFFLSLRVRSEGAESPLLKVRLGLR